MHLQVSKHVFLYHNSIKKLSVGPGVMHTTIQICIFVLYLLFHALRLEYIPAEFHTA